METNQKISKLKISWGDVTLDPINNFYKKTLNSLDESCDFYLNEYIKSNSSLIKYQTDCHNEIKQLEDEIVNAKKINKISLKMFLVGLIFSLFFFIIGFIWWKPYQRYKNDIRNFKNFEAERENTINDLKNRAYDYSKKFFSGFNFNEYLKSVADIYEISYKNDIFAKLANLFFQRESFLEFTNFLWFEFKNNPVVNVFSKHFYERDVTTSQSISFPYYETVWYMDSNGRSRTKRVLNHEVLTGTHVEPTPFIEHKNELFLLTNFEPDLDFWTGEDKYYDFENNDFSKIYKISSNKKSVDEKILSFFTIKAQEDYCRWANEVSKDVSMWKKQNAFYFEMQETKIQNLLNLKFNVANDLNNDLYINENLDLLKTWMKNYYTEIFTKIMLPFISPAINREWYDVNDNQYKIAHDRKDFDVPREFSIDYVLAKVFKEYMIYFCKHDAELFPFTKIVNVKKSNNIFEVDFTLNSYYSKELIDNVTVVGFHVGPKIIPVPFRRYYPILENKKMIFIKKTSSFTIPKFSFSSYINDSYFDILNSKNDFSFNTNNIGMYLLNPAALLNNDNTKYQRFFELLKMLKDSLTKHVNVESIDDGFVIVANICDKEFKLDNKTQIVVDKVKSIIKQLNEL